MAMGVTSNCSTTPRKRRPRAVGEVFITSESCVYLVNDSATTSETVTTENIHEPFYENAAAPPPLPRRRNRKGQKANEKASEITKPRLFTFNTCRVSMFDPKPEESSTELPTDAVLPAMETQYISVFIGENFKLCFNLCQFACAP